MTQEVSLLPLWISPLYSLFCADLRRVNHIDPMFYSLIGWAFYTMVLGTVMVFSSALLSIKAEESTSSDKVESEILDGKNLICIM